jgi:hypothetical protein
MTPMRRVSFIDDDSFRLHWDPVGIYFLHNEPNYECGTW